MIRGKTLPLGTIDLPPVSINTGIHNKFEVEVIDSITGKIKERRVGYNTLCNSIWSALVNRTAYFSNITYGSGSGVPSPEDTTLFEPVGYAAVDSSKDVYSVDYNTGVFSYQRRIQLSESTAVGKTISEVGIGTSTKIYTHAMLTDMNGNAISIEKTSTDIINIYATVYVHFDGTGFDNGSLRVDYYDKDYSLLTLFAGVSLVASPNYFIFSATTEFINAYQGIRPSDSSFSRDSDKKPIIEEEHRCSLTYIGNSTDRTLTLKAGRIPVAEGNLGGLLRFVIIHREISSAYSYYYAYIHPSLIITPGGSWFPYSEIVGESVGTGDGVTQDFPLSFVFAHDAQVYVDGVLRDDVTVDYLANHSYADLVRLSPKTISESNLIPFYGNVKGSAYEVLYFNRAYRSRKMQSATFANATLYASNDLSSWVELTSTTGAEASTAYTIPEEYKAYKYWKLQASSDTISGTPFTLEAHSGKALHFATPPAEGAAIVANYRSDSFAKDANHVFDLSITFHFGEYTESQ